MNKDTDLQENNVAMNIAVANSKSPVAEVP